MAKKKAKTKTTAYGLRFGHPNIFRRTITLGEGDDAQRIQMVFEPSVAYELTDEEVAALQPEIVDGILEPWNDGKFRRPRLAESPTPETDEALRKENADLREQIAALQSQNEELRDQIDVLTAPDTDVDEETTNPDAPLGDE